MRKVIENGWWYEYCDAEGFTDKNGSGFCVRNEKITIKRISLFIVLKKMGYSSENIKKCINTIQDRKIPGYKYKLTINDKMYKDFSKINFADGSLLFLSL